MSADIRPPQCLPEGESLRRVIVATDASEGSAGALRAASDIARAFDAELLVVHVLGDREEPRVVQDALRMEPGDLLERRAREAEGRLRHLESMVGTGHVHASVRCGSAATEIVRLATAVGADLIVLESHGPTTARGACGEPVAERVRERAPCPVIVALPPHDRERPSTGQGLSIHRVLVATELTRRSAVAITWGRALGQRLGCPVHIVDVIRAARRGRGAPSGPVGPDIIRVGDPAAQIVSCAQELGADLIVLGTHRRRALRRGLGRGVSRTVVDRPSFRHRPPADCEGTRRLGQPGTPSNQAIKLPA
jgi:nucleotide-binding universal stress UspA family protein